MSVTAIHDVGVAGVHIYAEDPPPAAADGGSLPCPVPLAGALPQPGPTRIEYAAPGRTP